MPNFQKRVTQQTIHGNGSFREDFLLDFSLQSDTGLLGFWGIGHGYWRDGYSSSGACVRSYSLELIREGSFQLYDWDHRTRRILKPGALFFFGPGHRKQLQALPDGNKTCIFFSNNPVITVTLDKIFREKDVIQLPDLSLIEKDFLNIYRCAAQNAPGTEILIFSMLEKLAAVIPINTYPQALNKILNLLEDPEALKMSREDLASSAGIGISTLNRLFEKHLHTTPAKYRRLKRLELACRLLFLKSMPLKEIASECGFSSTPFFCREFKELTGRTPTQYIRTHLPDVSKNV